MVFWRWGEGSPDVNVLGVAAGQSLEKYGKVGLCPTVMMGRG